MSYSGHKIKDDMKIKGKDENGISREIKVSQNGDMFVNVEKFERHGDQDDSITGAQSESLRIGGVTDGGNHKHLRVTSGGFLRTHECLVRSNGELKIIIPAGTTGYSNAIHMSDNQYLAFYGQLITTQSLSGYNQIKIEYSPDGTNWFRGAEGNSKIILVTQNGQDKGDFYESHRIITPYVRIMRQNTSTVDEVVYFKWTKA